MTIMAEFITPQGRFGLAAERQLPQKFCPDYYVVFSAHGTSRTRCQLECSICPLENSIHDKGCFTTPHTFLPKFGITPDTHPELFI